MDNLKSAIAWLKRQHFWVLGAVGIVATIVTWLLATSTLSALYKADKTKVEQEFSRVNVIKTAEELRNERTNKVLETRLNAVAQDVLAAWKLRFDGQKQVLRWPEGLGKDFNDYMQALPLAAEIGTEYRDLYAAHINRVEFPRLVQLAQARMFEEERKEQQHVGARAKPAAESVVRWMPPSQLKIYNKFAWTEKVSTRQVRTAQEDLWVYQAVLSIVRNLNKGVIGHFNANVKEIQELEAGKPAANAFLYGLGRDRIYIPPDAPRTLEPKQLEPPPHASDPATVAHFEANRYVDSYGRPLPAGAEMPTEYRRLPVRIVLLMDQRYIAKLLSECAESPLPIEVRQFRINPRSIDKGTRPPAAGGVGISRESTRRKDSDDKKDSDVGPFDLTVEVLGFVYLYNPPDMAKLGIKAPESETAVSEEPAAPAAAAKAATVAVAPR